MRIENHTIWLPIYSLTFSISYKTLFCNCQALLGVLTYLNDIFDTLLKALSDPSDEVVLLVLDVHTCISRDPRHLRQLVVFLVHNFRLDNSLLEKDVQSAAFKILKTHLKAVPSYSFNRAQLNREPSGDYYQISSSDA
ncbi:putative vacuole morphology and inheritance protein [Medicago truncatula]|uniref:Putative vacuole morphology and inheritance protein n=1 Tax=Medicago truncatula TaxID=3880 RepID=A0A396JPC6_MEDTR|nr:putative vacuole morphology and inheritance protein [Medicago truncatula]